MILLFSAWWFWIVVVEALLLIGLVANDAGWKGLFSLIVAALLLQFLAKVPIYPWVWDNYDIVLLATLIYFPIGGLWSLLKWTLLVREKLLEYRKLKISFLQAGAPDYEVREPVVIPENLREAWQRALLGKDDYPPKAYYHTERITHWICYWPISILITVFGDLLEKLAREVYEFLANIYKRIAARMFAEINKDFGKTL